MKKRRKARKLMPLPLLLLAHLLVLGVALLIYVLPHHVVQRELEAIGTVSVRPGANALANVTPVPATPVPATPAPSAQPEPDKPDSTASEALSEAPAVEPTGEPQAPPAEEKIGSFRSKFADHFTDGVVIRSDMKYQSANLDITISEHLVQEVQFYVVDIYIADISCFKTAMAKDTYGHGYQEWPKDLQKRVNSIITSNGDFYGLRPTGIVLRNGVLYQCTRSPRDVCVLYWDGTMKTFSPDEFDAEQEINNGAYQAWNFGPELLDENGEIPEDFNDHYDDMVPPSPRCAIGYFEPGHYCLVAVDGRTRHGNPGVTLDRLATIMRQLGCTSAYNLDGGQTAAMYLGQRAINKPYHGGRRCSDFITIMDRVEE